MLILALEFSTETRSAAVARVREGVAMVLQEGSDGGDRSVKPLELIDRVLKGAGIGTEEVEGVMVGLGPGSYTGVRSALAMAQGWELARGLPVGGWSSMECLAAGAQAQGWRGGLHLVIDAQRGEFYRAEYVIESDGYSEVEPLRLISAEAVRAGLSERPGILAGPGVRRWFGEGRELFPSASTLAGLSVRSTAWGSSERLEPIYLRPVEFVKAPVPRVLL